MPLPQQTVYCFSRSFLRKVPPWSFAATGDPTRWIIHDLWPDSVALNSSSTMSIMFSAVTLQNRHVTDCIPLFFCIEFPQTPFLRVIVGRHETNAFIDGRGFTKEIVTFFLFTSTALQAYMYTRYLLATVSSRWIRYWNYFPDFWPVGLFFVGCVIRLRENPHPSVHAY